MSTKEYLYQLKDNYISDLQNLGVRSGVYGRGVNTDTCIHLPIFLISISPPPPTLGSFNYSVQGSEG